MEVKDWVLNFPGKSRFHWVLLRVVWRQEIGKEPTPTSVVVHSILLRVMLALHLQRVSLLNGGETFGQEDDVCLSTV